MTLDWHANGGQGSTLNSWLHCGIELQALCSVQLFTELLLMSGVLVAYLVNFSQELLSFYGRTEIDQLQKMFKLLGTPNERIWPDFLHFRVHRK